MPLQLVIGPSGSGKTTYLYQSLIKEAEDSASFQAMAIVPEQFTMQTQKDLVTMHSRHSVTNIDILSFDRLAYRILEEQSAAGIRVLDDMGKVLVLRRAAATCGQELQVYRKNMNKAGFIDKVKSMLSELYQYRIGPEELDRLIGELAEEPLLRRKLEEIRTLYLTFHQGLEEDTIPSERLYDVLCQYIPQSRLIRNSVVTFDGFTGFTPAQYQVLEMLLQYARKVVVTVTADSDLTESGKEETTGDRTGSGRGEKTGEPEKYGNRQRAAQALLASRRQLFDMSLTIEENLHRLASAHQIPVEAPVMLPPGRRFAEAPSLAALERGILRYPVTPWQGETEEIRLWEVKNRGEELDCVAREIRRLVREEGLRYREIAVVSADVAGYEPVIRQVFSRYGIPCFMDTKNNMLGHPLVSYLRGALQVIEEDFTYDSVFSCLKSGMTSLSRNDLYELENYVLAMGIRGRRLWSETWEHTYPEARHLDMRHLNEVRASVAEPILALRQVFRRPEATVRDFAEGMVTLMQREQIEGRLQDMADAIRRDGEDSLASEYEQAYNKVLELLDQVVDLFGDGQVTLREWREILDTGFEEIRVGVIPARVDRVVAGDLHRTRLKDPKVIFLIGANDGLIPRTGEKSSLLSDLDRMTLEKHGVCLAPTRQENGFMDRFYLYLMLTKASRRLYVSWCRQAMDGSALLPSYIISELRSLFPGLPTEHPDRENGLLGRIVNEKTAREALLGGFAAYLEGQAPEDWKELYRCFLSRPEGPEKLGRILDTVFMTYQEESMAPAVARLLYGEQLEGSVTRLERYAACAYAQFLSYGLRLTERRLHEFAAADMGTLFHEIIRRFFAHVYGEDSVYGGTVEELISQDECRRQLVHDCLEEASQAGNSRGLEDTERGKYLLRRVEQIADRTLWALCKQIERGDFRPTEVEVAFDGRDSQAMNLVLDGDTIMRLYGRIDRVDTCEAGPRGAADRSEAGQRETDQDAAGQDAGDQGAGDAGMAGAAARPGEDEIYVKIIDYKTGQTTFDLVGVYYGLQLQLVVYLDAAMERESRRHRGRQIVPAGILYYHIQDPYIQLDPGEAAEPDPEALQNAWLKELKMSGLVNSDEQIYRRIDRWVGTDAPPVIPVTLKNGEIDGKRSSVAETRQFMQLCQFVRRRMKEFGSRIMAGDLAVNPYMKNGKTGCDYCSFRSVCGFDRKTPGYEYRRLDDGAAGKIWSSGQTGDSQIGGSQMGSGEHGGENTPGEAGFTGQKGR